MTRLRPEDQQEPVGDRHRQPHQQDELLVLRPRDERLHHCSLQAVADDEEGDRDRQAGDDGVEFEQAEENESRVHRQHGEFAMREIHDAHDPENDRQAERHQAVDEACEHALDQDFDGERKGHRALGLSSLSCARSNRPETTLTARERETGRPNSFAPSPAMRAREGEAEDDYFRPCQAGMGRMGVAVAASAGKTTVGV